MPSEHAEPVETAMPSKSSAIESESPLTPSINTLRVFQRSLSISPFSLIPAIEADNLSHNPSRSFFILLSSSFNSRSDISEAIPIPATAGTFSVPERLPLSCPPPWMRGRSRTFLLIPSLI